MVDIIDPNARIFRIVRFRFHSGRTRTIKTHLTLREAQEHCSREDTHKKGKWFDGYDYMPGCNPKED